MPNNRVVHFEITATQPERAAKFYTEVFGWDVKKWDGPMPYWLVMTGKGGKGIDGGILNRNHPEDRVVNCVTVDSVDNYCSKIKTSGGTITTAKTEIPGIGWIAYAQDTEGNDFSVMQPSPESIKLEQVKCLEGNTINWFEVPVKEVTRAVKFYETVLGTKLQVSEMGPGFKMAVFPLEGTGVHGALVQAEGYEPSEKGTVVYFQAGRDLAPALSRVKAAGGTVLKEKFSIGEHGFIAFFKDTEGNRVALHSIE